MCFAISIISFKKRKLFFWSYVCIRMHVLPAGVTTLQMFHVKAISISGILGVELI